MAESDGTGMNNGLVTRRRFLGGVSVALGAGIGALLGVPVVAFILAPLFKSKPDVWRPVGAVSQFPVGETRKATFEDPSPLPWSGASGLDAVWLRHTSETEFQAFSINCTHLGCPVRWIDTAELFMCPCHGGVFYRDGTVAAGPPKQPLVQHETRIVGSEVEVRTRPLKITGNLLHPSGEQ
jgi:menaquinol-cytochrome c reductase iron-sulfur subunit